MRYQVIALSTWWAMCRHFDDKRRHERGEFTATTVMIVLLSVAAITAGGVIANKIIGNANAVPSP